MLPPSTPDGFPRAGVTVDGQFLPGFLCYGIPVGSPVYVCHQLSLKVQEVAREVSLIVKVMKGEGQAIWTIARSSTAMKLDSAVLPEEYRKPLALLDQKYHNTQPGQVGPLQGYEDLQCLVMGAFLEGSKDLHSLLEVL